MKATCIYSLCLSRLLQEYQPAHHALRYMMSDYFDFTIVFLSFLQQLLLSKDRVFLSRGCGQWGYFFFCKSSFQIFYNRHHELVDPYSMSASLSIECRHIVNINAIIYVSLTGIVITRSIPQVLLMGTCLISIILKQDGNLFP